ncbi:hypothetical protein AGMMS49525_08600 [Bacteroidia bacterium]|nr:hypothetical protein AGMMS49525_08600 [Bacteroidia bacterium]
MNVLVACEYSGIVRDAFEDAGWNAWSCDLLPTESEQTKVSRKHYQGDVFHFLTKFILPDELQLSDDFPLSLDLMIGHPPCTYLSYAYTGKERYSIERMQKKIEAYQFFLDLWSAPIEHICLENPMSYIHSGLIPCTQIIEPYYFGDPYKKKTCLWLKNLPKLTYSEDTLFEKGTKVVPTHQFLDNNLKSQRKKLPILLPLYSDGHARSKFHKGIAKAMAEQWTEYLHKNL